MTSLTIPELPRVSAERRAEAVRQLLDQQAQQATSFQAEPSAGAEMAAAEDRPSHLGRLPSRELLDRGGRLSASANEAADHFVALVRCAYLVAAADHVSEDELDALAGLVAQAAGSNMQREQVLALFTRFGDDARNTGRTAQIANLAETLSSFAAREEALGFAVLIAVADGHLARKESRVLIELCEAFGFSLGELRLLLDQVGSALKRKLEQA